MNKTKLTCNQEEVAAGFSATRNFR